jgi:hypothetical protein
MSVCTRCGRGLIDPVSIQRGIGPVCWRRTHPDTVRRAPRPSHRQQSIGQLELLFDQPITPSGQAVPDSDPLEIPEFLRRRVNA